jgi:hypothetical protein
VPKLESSDVDGFLDELAVMGAFQDDSCWSAKVSDEEWSVVVALQFLLGFPHSDLWLVYVDNASRRNGFCTCSLVVRFLHLLLLFFEVFFSVLLSCSLLSEDFTKLVMC